MISATHSKQVISKCQDFSQKNNTEIIALIENLSQKEKDVLWAVLVYAKRYLDLIVAQNTFAELAEVSVSTVKRALNKFSDLRLVKKINRGTFRRRVKSKTCIKSETCRYVLNPAFNDPEVLGYINILYEDKEESVGWAEFQAVYLVLSEEQKRISKKQYKAWALYHQLQKQNYVTPRQREEFEKLRKYTSLSKNYLPVKKAFLSKFGVKEFSYHIDNEEKLIKTRINTISNKSSKNRGVSKRRYRHGFKMNERQSYTMSIYSIYQGGNKLEILDVVQKLGDRFGINHRGQVYLQQRFNKKTLQSVYDNVPGLTKDQVDSIKNRLRYLCSICWKYAKRLKQDVNKRRVPEPEGVHVYGFVGNHGSGKTNKKPNNKDFEEQQARIKEFEERQTPEHLQQEITKLKQGLPRIPVEYRFDTVIHIHSLLDKLEKLGYENDESYIEYIYDNKDEYIDKLRFRHAELQNYARLESTQHQLESLEREINYFTNGYTLETESVQCEPNINEEINNEIEEAQERISSLQEILQYCTTDNLKSRYQEEINQEQNKIELLKGKLIN